LIVDAVFSIDFAHTMVYGALITLALQLGTVAAFSPSIVRAVRQRRELSRLKGDIDVALERVLPTRHGPWDYQKALAGARTILNAVRAASHSEANEPTEDAVKRATEELVLRYKIEMDEVVLGPNDPKVGEGLHRLAFLLQVLDRASEAEPLIKRALSIAERASRSMRVTRIGQGPLVSEQQDRG
jgi:hypothetical protein